MTAYLKAVDYLESSLDKVGLMTGNNAVAKRMAFGGLVGGFITTYFKPSFMFMPNGEPRQWAMISTNEQESTWFPWWTGAVIGGFSLGVLV